jgi:hypothetical protein
MTTPQTPADTSRLQQLAEQVIEALARESMVEVHHVRALYEAEHARLLEHAKIKTYVPVIAARLVRTALSQSSARVQ